MSDEEQTTELVIVLDSRVGLVLLTILLAGVSLIAGVWLGRQVAQRSAAPPAVSYLPQQVNPLPARSSLPQAPVTESDPVELRTDGATALPRTELPSGDSSSRARLAEPAPDFGLETLDGDLVHLGDFQGQAVMINFWATWCPPCRFEMPMLESAWRQYKDQGFVILGVNTGERVRAGRLQQEVGFFVNQMGLTFPILLDAEEKVANLYNLRAYPTSFFIGRDGVLVDVRRGAFASSAELDAYINRILGSSGGQ